MTERVITAKVTDDVSSWLDGATPEHVGLALACGYHAVRYVERSLSAVAPVVEISQVKGVRGETHVLRALRDEFQCESVTGKTASGDISIWYDNQKLMVEVKNYTRPVPAAEIAKFLRDLEAVNASAGLFVSLCTRVTGVTDNFESRMHPLSWGMIPITYIVADDPHVIVNAAKMTLTHARMRREVNVMVKTAHAEVRNVDKCIDMCAHARLQTYELAAATTVQLSKIAATIQTAEALGRECIEKIGAVEPCGDLVQVCIDALPGHWTATARKRNHPSGVTIDLSKKTPHLYLPAVMSRTRMDECLRLGGSVTQEGATIPLTVDSIDGCLALLK